MKQIPLSKGLFAVCDDKDFSALAAFNWQAYHDGCTWYARRTYRGRTILMHAQIMQTPQGLETDHIDGNGLNNCRSNLRIVTRLQNNLNRRMQRNNTSGFKGVDFNKRRSKWRARIAFNHRTVCLGYHDTPEKAAEAYRSAAKELHGEFARE